MKLDKSQILITSLLSITTCSGLVLSMSHTYADNSVTDNITITVPEACSISSTIDTAHTATFSAGTWSGAEGSDYENGIGKTTLTTFCNDNNGFSIYAIGFTNDTLGTTTLVGSNTNMAIPTKAYESGDTASNWSMKITKVENPVSGDPVTWNPNNLTISNSFNSWHAVPSEYTRVAEYHAQTGSSTTDTTLGAKLETTYATFISATQVADTYTGKVKYVMVHPYAADPDPYKPSTSVSIEDAYAAAGKQKLNGYYKMQEMSGSICEMVTLYDEASQTQLIDIRDNKTYYVAKLQDSNCWMTQNLDHDIVTTANYYTNENTDIGYNSSTGTYDTASWTADYATHTSSGTNWCDESGPWDSNNCNYYSIASYNPGELYWSGEIDDVYPHENKTSSTGNPHYHLGNYYNWNATVATNDTSSLTEGTLMDRSICPAGWTLPRAGTGADGFYSLLNEYAFTSSTTQGNNNIWDGPLYFGLFGAVGGMVNDRPSSIGYMSGYWTPNIGGVEDYGGYAFNLSIYGGQVASVDLTDIDGGGLLIGKSVRCIARPVTNTIEGF